MKTLIKIGISAISVAAVASAGYFGKKAYDKKKKDYHSTTTETESDTTTEMLEETAE